MFGSFQLLASGMFVAGVGVQVACEGLAAKGLER